MSEDNRRNRQSGQQGSKHEQRFTVHISEEDYREEINAEEYERSQKQRSYQQGQRSTQNAHRTYPRGDSRIVKPEEPRRGPVPVARTRVITSTEGERYEIPDESSLPAALLGRPRKNSKSRGCVVAVVYALIICSISALLAFYMVVGINDMFALVKDDTEIVVSVPEGADLSEITRLLDENDVVDYPFFFTLYAKLTSSDAEFKSGDFKLSRKTEYGQLIDRLTQPAIAEDGVVKITFREGLTVREIAVMLEDNCVCDSDKFFDTLQNYPFKHDFIPNIPTDDPNRVYRLEGYLFPDTYSFYLNEGSVSAINKMLNNFKSRVLDSKSVLFADKASDLGYSMDEIITIASIIERESNDKDEMKTVASIFYNRLENIGFEGIGGKLQSDATRWYPFPTGKAMREDSELTDEEKENWVGAYDTNTFSGLPAGAICCPGINSINAALNPTDSNYFYFFIDDEDKHYYARTYQQHLNNIETARANGKYSG